VRSDDGADDDLRRLHAGDAAGHDHDYGGTDINDYDNLVDAVNKHVYDGVDNDVYDAARSFVNHSGDYVLVRRADYDNLVAAINNDIDLDVIAAAYDLVLHHDVDPA
jgi:hypothetical protein